MEASRRTRAGPPPNRSMTATCLICAGRVLGQRVCRSFADRLRRCRRRQPAKAVRCLPRQGVDVSRRRQSRDRRHEGGARFRAGGEATSVDKISTFFGMSINHYLSGAKARGCLVMCTTAGRGDGNTGGAGGAGTSHRLARRHLRAAISGRSGLRRDWRDDLRCRTGATDR